MVERDVTLVALAGLLHDIGKFAQRAGRAGSHAEIAVHLIDEFGALFPLAWRDDLRDAVENHHASSARTEIEKITRVADWLAAGERPEAMMAQTQPNETPLKSIAADVDIGQKMPSGKWGYGLHPLGLEPREVFFPAETNLVNKEAYAALWSEFDTEIGRLASGGPIDSALRLTSLLMLLQRFTWCIPSATPSESDEEHRTLPDISLYDHLKATAAIATCLHYLLPDEVDALHRHESAASVMPVASMLRADFSGIQDFIYRIAATRVDATYRGAAKRLRGRSFYLALLGDVVAEWFVRELGLTSVSVLFSGGGRFDLLVPLKASEQLLKLERQIQQWLLDEFYGELGLQIAIEPVTPLDFGNLHRVYTALEDQLALTKMRKWDKFVQGEWIQANKFHIPEAPLFHTCSVCNLTPLSERGICGKCEMHLVIGKKLPKTQYLAMLYGEAGQFAPKDAVTIEFKPFDVTAALLEKDEVTLLLQSLKGDEVQATLYRLNETNVVRDDAPHSVALGFRFLANAAPLGKDGEVMDFEEIAELSEGAHLLGVLKADVDHLGLIFGEGLHRPVSSDRPWATMPTISRVSNLSHTLDLFFAGWLGKLCEQVGKFYVVYSGGDDLLVLGPWDQILELARRLYEDFRAYTCHNENVTLSGGIVLVKPHFPIQRFARLASEAMERAKDAGRNRVTVFDETVTWTEEEGSFARLMEFGKALAERVENAEMPKGFVYFMKALHDQHFNDEERPNPMWIPKYHYSLARRLSKEVIADPTLNLLADMPERMPHIQIPVSYVSLKTRKE